MLRVDSINISIGIIFLMWCWRLWSSELDDWDAAAAAGI